MLPVHVGNDVVEVVDNYVNLGQMIQLERFNFEKEANQRM